VFVGSFPLELANIRSSVFEYAGLSLTLVQHNSNLVFDAVNGQDVREWYSLMWGYCAGSGARSTSAKYAMIAVCASAAGCHLDE